MSGLVLSNDQISALLARLNMPVANKLDSVWHITPPSYRFDITIAQDLVEELLRIHGYDKLPCALLSSTPVAPPKAVAEDQRATIGQFFAQAGYHETVSFAFTDPEIQNLLWPDTAPLMLKNPISTELSAMRLSLWPGLLAAMMFNLNRQKNPIMLFEMGNVFTKSNNQDYQEQECVAGLMTGEINTLQWASPNRLLDFFDLKG